jgi:hypothetical protein
MINTIKIRAIKRVQLLGVRDDGADILNASDAFVISYACFNLIKKEILIEEEGCLMQIYTKQEMRMVYKKCKNIVNIKYQFLLSIFQIIPSIFFIILKKNQKIV